MAARGEEVTLFGIHKDTNIAADAMDLVERTHYLYPLNYAQLIGQSLKYALVRPQRFWPCIIDSLRSKDDSLKARLKLVFHLLASSPLATQMHKMGIEHLHAHFLNVPSSIAMFVSRLSGIPFSITLHSAGEEVLPSVNGIALKLKFAENLLMISQYNIDHYSKIYPCQEKSSVVRCGIDVPSFIPRPFKAFDSAGGDTLNLLAVGRFVEKKGFQVLLAASKILRDKGLKFSLEILGSGPLMDECKAFVADNQLDAFVSLPGMASTDTVKAKMLAADAVIVPSTTGPNGEMEGIPVVIMESMASGIPVIATRHSGIPELINETTGSLVEENNPKALAEAIMQFEANETKIQAARALIEKEFNIHTVVDQRLSLFKTRYS